MPRDLPHRRDGQFEVGNPALARMLRRGEGSEIRDLAPDEVWTRSAELARAVAQARAGGPVGPLDAEWRRRDGTTFVARVTGRGVEGADGKLVALDLLVEDVTERRSLELQLQRAQKMEAVGRLAGGIAHDFNNLLVAILGYSEVMMGLLPEGAPLRRHAEEISKAGERAAALTKRLLGFSRGQVIDVKAIDVSAVVRDLAHMIGRLLGADVRLSTVLAPGLGRVLADRSQLEQVVLNLAVNARDAMPHGGALTIETSEATAPPAADGAAPAAGGAAPRYVALTVRDTGTGMTPEVRARLFEPFFTTKEEGKGTGLGLSTVYSIVRQFGGDVSVWTELGKGSAFTARFPCTDVVSTDAVTSRTARPRGPVGRETVLVVEDEPSVLALTKEVLEEAGYRVIDAPSGLRAKEILDRPDQPVHLVVTDLVMPDMGGLDLVESVSASRPGLKVLLTSGYTARGIDANKLRNSTAAFLQKPFRPDALLHKVRALLDAPANSSRIAFIDASFPPPR